MHTAKITSFAQIPAAVASVLGFTPVDSLVVLAIGGGPTARVDADMDLTEPLTGLLPAAPHWRESSVIVVLFGTGHDLPTLAMGWQDIMDVDVIDFLHVSEIDGTKWVTSLYGNETIAADATGIDLPAPAMATREELVAEAAEVESADAAWAVARTAYRAGEGARASVYLDRFVALNGGHTMSSRTLDRFLTDAVDPKSALAQTFLTD